MDLYRSRVNRFPVVRMRRIWRLPARLVRVLVLETGRAGVWAAALHLATDILQRLSDGADIERARLRPRGRRELEVGQDKVYIIQYCLQMLCL